MDFSFLNSYISVVTLTICLIVGFIIKTCFTNDKLHQFIPVIVAVLGVGIYAWDTMSFSPEVLAFGLVSGLASTGLYEALRNVLKVAHKEDMLEDPSEEE